MIESRILDFKNKVYAYIQDKLAGIVNNSVILSKIDEIILFFIGVTLFTSVFMQSEQIGLFALIVVFLTILKLCTKKGAKVALTVFDGALLVYFVICFISTINSTLVPQSIHGFLKTVIYIFYYFSVVNYFQSNQSKIKYILLLVSSLCFVEGIIALIQNFAGVEQISTWQDSRYINPEDAIARAYGSLKPYNPNLLGGYLVAGNPYIIATGVLFLIKKHYKLFLFSLLAFVICSFAVFITGSRGAYLGLGAIVVGFISLVTILINTDFASVDKLKSLWHKIIVAIIACFAVILVAVPKITKRILSIFILRGDSSTSFRMNVYNSSWHMFCDNWILGIGAGNQTFREIYGYYMLTGYDALSTYSVPLEIAVESGIFGLIAFIAFLCLFIFDGYKFIKCSDCTNSLADKVIVCASILTILGVMTHGMFDTIYFRPQLQFLFWTMIAMSSSVMCKRIIENNEV